MLKPIFFLLLAFFQQNVTQKQVDPTNDLVFAASQYALQINHQREEKRPTFLVQRDVEIARTNHAGFITWESTSIAHPTLFLAKECYVVAFLGPFGRRARTRLHLDHDWAKNPKIPAIFSESHQGGICTIFSTKKPYFEVLAKCDNKRDLAPWSKNLSTPSYLTKFRLLDENWRNTHPTNLQHKEEEDVEKSQEAAPLGITQKKSKGFVGYYIFPLISLDFVLYWIHRMQHDFSLFKHRQKHHTNYYPYDITKEYVKRGFWDSLDGYAYLGVAIFPHCYLVFGEMHRLILPTLYGIFSFWIHAQYHLSNRSILGKWPLFRWLQRFHANHHQHPSFNHALFFPFFDWLFGTLFIGGQTYSFAGEIQKIVHCFVPKN